MSTADCKYGFSMHHNIYVHFFPPLVQEVDERLRLPAEKGRLSRELSCDVSAESRNKIQPILNQAKSEQLAIYIVYGPVFIILCMHVPYY